MTAGDERAKAREQPEPGRRYAVTYKHERLRRSFRFEGAYLGSEEREVDGAVVTVWLFEVKPRFGKSARQPVDPETLVTIEPA